MRLAQATELQLSGHWIRGHTDAGAPLSDVPPSRIDLGITRALGDWTLRALWQHRFASDDPGSGEKPVGSADLLSLQLTGRLGERTQIAFTATNLLDAACFASGDEKVPLSPGRSLGVHVSTHWKP